MSSFGRLLRISTFGESHCPSVGVVIDGLPPRIPLCEADIQRQLDRRRPGQSALTTSRAETDTVRIHSGVEHGVTLGTPVCLVIPNKDTRPQDYHAAQSNNNNNTNSGSENKDTSSNANSGAGSGAQVDGLTSPSRDLTFIPRPSHADYTYLAKYGVSASSGGGRASARETAARVAAGAVAERLLERYYSNSSNSSNSSSNSSDVSASGISIVAYVSQIGPVSLADDVARARERRHRQSRRNNNNGNGDNGDNVDASADGGNTEPKTKADDTENADEDGWAGVDGWLDHERLAFSRKHSSNSGSPFDESDCDSHNDRDSDDNGAKDANDDSRFAPPPVCALPPGPQRRLTRADVDATLVRCPRPATARKMEKIIKAAAKAKDSVGGVVSCVIYGLPAGLGEPCFDKLEAMLAHAMLSIPASKGFEFGSGFACAGMYGSHHNDPFTASSHQPDSTAIAAVTVTDGCSSDSAHVGSGFPSPLVTVSNHSGGVQGGISNGASVVFRVAFKPAATIGQDQDTVTLGGAPAVLRNGGRHDPCVASRAVPVVEAMAALVLADALLLQLGREAAARADAYIGRACDYSARDQGL